MITPPWKMKPSVVVPWLGFTYSTTSRSKESIYMRQQGSDQWSASSQGGGQMQREAGAQAQTLPERAKAAAGAHCVLDPKQASGHMERARGKEG